MTNREEQELEERKKTKIKKMFWFSLRQDCANKSPSTTVKKNLTNMHTSDDPSQHSPDFENDDQHIQTKNG